MPIINPYASGTGATVSIGDQTVTSVANSPGTANAGYRLGNDGNIYSETGSGFFDGGTDWINPTSAAGSAYEVRALIVSGSVSSGTIGSWQALSSNWEWIVSRSTIGTSTAVLTIEIRLASDGSVLDSATITIEATVEL